MLLLHLPQNASLEKNAQHPHPVLALRAVPQRAPRDTTKSASTPARLGYTRCSPTRPLDVGVADSFSGAAIIAKKKPLEAWMQLPCAKCRRRGRGRMKRDWRRRGCQKPGWGRKGSSERTAARRQSWAHRFFQSIWLIFRGEHPGISVQISTRFFCYMLMLRIPEVYIIVY